MAVASGNDSVIATRRENNSLQEGKMDRDNQICHEDPQFVKMLRTCLKMEIAAANKRLEDNSAKIRRMQVVIRNELDRRKKLKERTMAMERIKMTLSEILTGLVVSVRESSDILEITKANADNEYRLIQLRSREYQSIVVEFKETWQSYHSMYEEFPLAKNRNLAKVKLGKLQIELMIMTYKKNESTTIVRQQRRIAWIRTRCKIIEFAGIMAERLKLEDKLTKLKANVDSHRRKLRSIEMELQMQRKREEDQRRLRKQKMLEMAPPKINIPRRQMYVQKQMLAGVQYQRRKLYEPNEDTISINTVILEELCINDNSTISPGEADLESARDNNSECIVDQTDLTNDSPIKNSAGKSDTPVASAAPDIEARAEEAVLPDNDKRSEETHQRETQGSREPAKERVSFSRVKESFFKQSAAQDTQDKIKTKRNYSLLQSENDEESTDKIAASQPPAAVESAGMKSLPSMPKIRKIETVHYDVTPIPKFVRCLPSVASDTASCFEYCDSNMTIFNKEFVSKGTASMQGSLCNYRLSPDSNISSMYEENARMASSTKHTLQQSSNMSSPFLFNKSTKKPEGKFTLF